MASVTYYAGGLSISLVLLLILPLPCYPSNSVGSLSSRGSGTVAFKQTKMVLGSRPPQCLNRCFSCRPCMATLVAPPHHRNGFKSPSKEDESSSYYLLAWKCKCGSRYYEP